MPELQARFKHSDSRIPNLHTRAEPDDLYDPPEELENVDPYKAEADDYDLDEFDIYGLNDIDEDDD